ncbi:hypothetical protein [Vibrio crassostreae]|uniref:hypothetical protein n=1 Tax=Vibrio crassostreae TaxID=246167 RepID=UPI001B313897|nr:hypothetical protein [Vibrio crassostreae]
MKHKLLAASLTAFMLAPSTLLAEQTQYRDIEQGAFYLALNNQSPEHGTYTKNLQNYFEVVCKAELSTKQITSDGFNDLTVALIASDRRTTNFAKDKELSMKVLNIINASNECNDFSGIFNAIADSGDIKQFHPEYAEFMNQWRTIASQMPQ